MRPLEAKRAGLWLGLASLLVCFAPSPLQAKDADAPVLRLGEPMTTVINARRWDQTAQQWRSDADQKDPLFFDAVHRFLFLRFPDSAERIQEQLAGGYEIAKAELVMTWTRQEFMRCEGYTWRSWPMKDKPMPKCHARVYALSRPWIDDAKLGPTWNAYINGAGYWRAGGGLSPFADRHAHPLGDAGLNAEEPTGKVDVTAALTSPEFGATVSHRLRRLADCGFQVRKLELMHREFGGNGGLGTARIWVRDPELVVTFKKAGRATPLDAPLPKAVDVRALAAKLKASGGDGEPTTVIPENLAELIAQRRSRRQAMPEWMRNRVRELLSLHTKAHKIFMYYAQFNDLALADRDKYLAAIDEILSIPPGYFLGHSHVEPILCLIDCDPLWPDVVRYHLRKYIESRWQPPYEMTVFQHRVGYFGDMSTLNLATQGRAEAILAGEQLGLSDVAVMGRRALSLLNRQMIYSEGTIQERGDSFYQAITLGNLQAIAKYSVDPLTRLKAALGVEKMIFELNSTYHPGLKRQVSTVGRRYRIADLLLKQDAPRGVLHTLSKKGVLIHRDKANVHGLGTMYFNPCPPERVALLAPWGREWESNAIDEKPLPFASVSTDHVRGLIDNPIYYVNYMGKHYELASMHSIITREWPNQAVWKRTARDVRTMDDLGILFIWDYLNGKPMNPMKHGESEGQGPNNNALLSCLQHKGKMIYCMRPTEWTYSAKSVAEAGGLKDIFSRVFIYAYGPEEGRQLFVNGEPVKAFPVTCKQGDVITIHEGVSYVGLIPLPATDMGRKAEVRITYKYPRLMLDSYILESDKPLPADEKSWGTVLGTTAGWIVELGDVTEYGSFEAFQKHMHAAKVKQNLDEAKPTLHVAYTSGTDTLEMGFHIGVMREVLHKSIEPPRIVAYHRVNGKRPYPARGIDLDCPLGQMGSCARLEKNGAVLETVAGQRALLKVEPVSKTTVGINPFIDPTPFRLTTAEGIVVKADGPLGCGRVTVRPTVNTLEVDYHLPPAAGDRGVEILQADAKAGKHGGLPQYESKLTKYFRPGVDVTRARRDSARAVLVTGFQGQPKVVLNGQPLPGPFEKMTSGGKTWYRIPIVIEP